MSLVTSREESHVTYVEEHHAPWYMEVLDLCDLVAEECEDEEGDE